VLRHPVFPTFFSIGKADAEGLHNKAFGCALQHGVTIGYEPA